LKIDTYGNAYYFPTLEDAEVWRGKKYLERWIPQWEEALAAWNNRDNVPFNQRPSFAPIHDEEDIQAYKLELQSLQGIVEPVRLGYVDADNDEEDC
jgi:hypothetical protein